MNKPTWPFRYFQWVNVFAQTLPTPSRLGRVVTLIKRLSEPNSREPKTGWSTFNRRKKNARSDGVWAEDSSLVFKVSQMTRDVAECCLSHETRSAIVLLVFETIIILSAYTRVCFEVFHYRPFKVFQVPHTLVEAYSRCLMWVEYYDIYCVSPHRAVFGFFKSYLT